MSGIPSNTVRQGRPSRTAQWLAAMRAVRRLFDQALIRPDAIALVAITMRRRAAPVGPAGLSFDLAPGTCTVFDDAVGVQIRCLEGRLWLTHAGQYEDVDLRPGDVTQIAYPGRTLVMTCGAARFTARGMWRPADPQRLVPSKTATRAVQS